MSGQKRAEQARQHLARAEALRPQTQEAVNEKLTSSQQETIRQTPGEKLTPSVEEMAQKLRQRRREKIAQTEKPAPRPRVRQNVSEWFRPAPPSHHASVRQGPRLGM
jgi:hypothetical protein